MTPFGLYVFVLGFIFVGTCASFISHMLYRVYLRSSRKRAYVEINTGDVEMANHLFSPIEQFPSRSRSNLSSLDSDTSGKPAIPKVRSSNGLDIKLKSSGEVELEFPLVVDNSNLTPKKYNNSGGRGSTSPTTSQESVQSREEVLEDFAAKVDSFVRHRKDFVAPNYFYSVKQLETQLPVPKEFKEYKLTLLQFLKSRPEFKMHSNLSFSLVHLTPYRGVNIRLYGKFQCNNAGCPSHTKTRWTSCYSFCDSYQQCPKCRTRVYPYEQRLFNTLSRRELAGCQESQQYFERQYTELEGCAADVEVRRIHSYQQRSEWLG